MTLEQKFFLEAEKSKHKLDNHDDLPIDRQIIWAANEIKHLRAMLEVYQGEKND